MPIEINLLPGGAAKKKKKRGGTSRSAPSIDLGAYFADLKARITDPLLLGAVASVALVGLSVGSLHLAQQRREVELTERVEKGVQDSTRYTAVLAARASAEAARDTVLRRLNIIRAIDGERFIWPHVLDEVSRALTPYTWVTALSFNGQPQGNAISQAATLRTPAGAKPDTAIARDELHVRLGGQTVDIQALTRFMRQLEQSPFLEKVNLERSELVLVDGKEVTQFMLDMVYSRPDSTAIQRVPLTVSVR